MRPYEVCEIKPSDILMDDPDCWIYIPGRDESPFGNHKTTRFERVRVIPLTVESQRILKPRIKGLTPSQYVFKPAEAPKIVNKKIRDKYDHNTFCKAVKRGCIRAGVDVFVPYDIRGQQLPALDRFSEKKQPRSCLDIRRRIRLTFTYLMKFKRRLRWRSCWPPAIKVPALVTDLSTSPKDADLPIVMSRFRDYNHVYRLKRKSSAFFSNC